ncbi:MAG: hypothetical protein HQL19_01430 [Candidatus Omnitrophica bacterium]|nr:hypothetical protein [Candidatus Omnitrophota bacterium]
MRPRIPGTTTAILFTGGLDSTILALLAAPQQPLLVFGAIKAPACFAYNQASIIRCRKIAKALDLPFCVITITRHDYTRHFQRAARQLTPQTFDEDLPAVSCLLSALKQRKIRRVISGMDAEGQAGFRLHRALARTYGITFQCPYLSRPVAASCTRPALEHILYDAPHIHALLNGLSPAHSSIPPYFWHSLKNALWPKTA